MKTATKPQKMKKEVRKIRRELGGVLIVLARLDKKRGALNVTDPDLDAALSVLARVAALARPIAQRSGRAD